jgi:hypothetical protein
MVRIKTPTLPDAAAKNSRVPDWERAFKFFDLLLQAQQAPHRVRRRVIIVACITQHDGLFYWIVTVLRAEGLRVIIFVDDHLPAHVHVFGDGHAKINLIGPDGTPELVWADRMTRGEIRRALRVVVEARAVLLARWESIHGRID